MAQSDGPYTGKGKDALLFTLYIGAMDPTHHLVPPLKSGGGQSARIAKEDRILAGFLIVLTIIAICVTARAIAIRRKHEEGFASDGGPAGRVLLGGSVVAHDMYAAELEKSPCTAEDRWLAFGIDAPMRTQVSKFGPQIPNRMSGQKREGFEPQTWDERSNFTPNPHPKKVSLLGHDLMGVPRKFESE